MATIHTERNSERLILNQGHAQCEHANDQAMRTPGSFYLPSVFGLSWLQPSRMRDCSRGTVRHPDPVSAKPLHGRTGSGCWAIAGRRVSTPLRVN